MKEEEGICIWPAKLVEDLQHQSLEDLDIAIWLVKLDEDLKHESLESIIMLNRVRGTPLQRRR